LFEFPELPEPPELPPPPPLEDIAAESAFFKALASISVDLQGLALNASTNQSGAEGDHMKADKAVDGNSGSRFASNSAEENTSDMRNSCSLS